MEHVIPGLQLISLQCYHRGKLSMPTQAAVWKHLADD